MNRLCLIASIGAAAAFAGGSTVRAATFTIAGFGWDTDNGFTDADGTYVGTNSASGFPTGFPGDASVGRLLENSAGTEPRRATIGAIDNRDAITLTLPTGKSLPNLPGNDFVTYEQGDVAQPEAYAVAVRKTGASAFSPFRYEIWDSQEGLQIATAFDLTSFGLSASDTIDAIAIRNLTNGHPSNITGLYDFVPVGGQGEVLTTSTSSGPVGYVYPIGFGAGKDQVIPAGEHDPDLSYVGVLHNLVVPEPASLALLALGGGVALLRRR